ncbi:MULTISPECIES: DUF2333 family protein [unclassified Agarivorans]|uniref:DUF2333 family protein n=1 Tax=unclassified Agarivorans TaxID=2636026 RepID=UPI0026E36A18|nr:MULTISPECIES: DUF2333 family protein [unclassified Agarivorans]MDO6684882.1 DUF2333 family protein [Agarivorans sp. 3_MG-2023]MDO6714957.1 DUF2333 family protein [Agarivorans sp. 2_MG-2023]
MFQLTGRKVIIFFLVFFVINYIIAVIWSSEPERVNVKEYVQEQALANGEEVVTGYATTTALMFVAETLLNKPGGYLSNDKMLPSVLMDNMPSWELGALNQVRDLSLIMRKDFSRSQAQSVEHAQLKIAQPKFNIDHTSWQLPSAEREYQDAIDALLIYRTQLADPTDPNAQFYARADNLVTWLGEVQSRLGSMSQKLSASVGRERINTSLVGSEGAAQSTFTPTESMVKTSWWKIDDVFYEARGEAWALLHFFQAVEVDFKGVLEKKNATVAVRQIVRELEATQETVWSPMILNGTGFGLMANHSLVMANYVSRANAAIINLNNLLTKG